MADADCSAEVSSSSVDIDKPRSATRHLHYTAPTSSSPVPSPYGQVAMLSAVVVSTSCHQHEAAAAHHHHHHHRQGALQQHSPTRSLTSSDIGEVDLVEFWDMDLRHHPSGGAMPHHHEVAMQTVRHHRRSSTSSPSSSSTASSTVASSPPLPVQVAVRGSGKAARPRPKKKGGGGGRAAAASRCSPPTIFYAGSTGREDLSPTGSVNGNTMDSFRESRRNRAGGGGGGGGGGVGSVGGVGAGGPASRQQEELCLVCGDRASGYHYNALTCEGCKGFFRRSITKNAVYQCKYGNNCEIDMYMRRKCQECRLKKCLKVGMRPECVVPEYQCAVKREAKRAQKDKDKPNSTTKDRVSSPDPIRGDDSSPRGSSICGATGSVIGLGGSSVGQSKGVMTTSTMVVSQMQLPVEDTALTVEEEELIERLCFFQEEYEAPSSDDLLKIQTPQIVPENGEGDSRYKHITEITIYTIRLIVEFAKRVPWFDTLLREDQITLLKACSSEVMMLRTARRYDITTDSIVFANDQPYTRDNYNSAGLGDCTNAIFHFCKQMCVMKVDNAEYALVTAIVLFSERPSLTEPKKVEKIQDIYLEALRKYVIRCRPKSGLMFARLLSVLTELRTLGSLNSEMCFSLKLKNKQLPAFLAEIWDINS